MQDLKLDPQFGMAPTLTRYAQIKHVSKAWVFYVTAFGTYLLVMDNDPIYEGNTAEEVAVYIDILAAYLKRKND